jgi:PucR C-terminal helix-turn-helix domain/GGDEF-like domain
VTGMRASEIEGHGRDISARLQSEIGAYGRVGGSEIEVDLLAIVKRNFELYLRALATDTVPEPAELVEFEEVCARRLRQGFPLEAVLRAGRLESQAMWEIVLSRAPADRAADMASLTMRYLDAINSASERGYVHAREDLGRSRDEATRLFLARLIGGDFADEAEAGGEARLLGFDLDRFRVAIVVAPDNVQAARRSAQDMLLAEAAGELKDVFPGSPWGLVESGLVLAVPATSPEEVFAGVQSALARPRTQGQRLIAGLGAPRAGSSGLKAGFTEARRALALGSVLNPREPVHRYDELRVFDLFKEDRTVDSFVQEVLSPLLELDRARGAHTIETLDAYFTCGMVRKAASAELGVHPNTLDYRLREIEQALGFPVRFGPAAFKLQLALKLLPLARQFS